MATATTPERHAQWPRNFPRTIPPRTCVLGLRPLLPGNFDGLWQRRGRTQHPAEMFGEDWYLDECWGIDPELIAKTRKESSN